MMEGSLRFTCFALWLFSFCVALRPAAPAATAQERSKRPLIIGIDHVTIYASNIKKSRHFYSDVLGLAVGCPQYTGPETCYLVRGSDQRLLLKPASAQTKGK